MKKLQRMTLIFLNCQPMAMFAGIAADNILEDAACNDQIIS